MFENNYEVEISYSYIGLTHYGNSKRLYLFIEAESEPQESMFEIYGKVKDSPCHPVYLEWCIN